MGRRCYFLCTFLVTRERKCGAGQSLSISNSTTTAILHPSRSNQTSHHIHFPSMSPPLHPSQLLFPSAHTTYNSTLTNLHRHNLTISNRLASITQDATFVERVGGAHNLPLIANERCGSWYVPPSLKTGSAYFKSTDGHHGQWGFSLRRLNVQVLEVVGRSGG